MISRGAPNFELVEFERVSDAPLRLAQREHAVWHSEQLQRVRNAINTEFEGPAPGEDWRISVTSFVRAGANSDHASGAAVDWNVKDHEGNRNDMLTLWARDWFASRDAGAFAELIYERDHVHHSRRGFSIDSSANESPQILDETSEGTFVVASLGSFVIADRRTQLVLVALVSFLISRSL